MQYSNDRYIPLLRTYLIDAFGAAKATEKRPFVQGQTICEMASSQSMNAEALLRQTFFVCNWIFAAILSASAQDNPNSKSPRTLISSPTTP